MAFGFFCPGSGTEDLMLMLVAIIAVALPAAVGAGFVSALVKFVRELNSVNKKR